MSEQKEKKHSTNILGSLGTTKGVDPNGSTSEGEKGKWEDARATRRKKLKERSVKKFSKINPLESGCPPKGKTDQLGQSSSTGSMWGGKYESRKNFFCNIKCPICRGGGGGCAHCDNKGHIDLTHLIEEHLKKCEKCRGSGESQVKCKSCNNGQFKPSCATCNNEGFENTKRLCNLCKGAGCRRKIKTGKCIGGWWHRKCKCQNVKARTCRECSGTGKEKCSSCKNGKILDLIYCQGIGSRPGSRIDASLLIPRETKQGQPEEGHTEEGQQKKGGLLNFIKSFRT